jgi:hypothetical protein
LALSFRIAAWAAWPVGDIALPMSLRRRASPVGQRALTTALSVLPVGRMPRYVLSSRHGEITRTTGLLTALAEEGAVSPADFSMAVHHGLAGLLSIHTGNKEGHTAIAAGPDSFAYGLIESATTVAESGKPVLHLHFDEALPEIYGPVADGLGHETILAMLLDPTEGESYSLDRAPAANGTADPAAGFVEFLSSGAATGGAGPWRWSRDD